MLNVALSSGETSPLSPVNTNSEAFLRSSNVVIVRKRSACRYEGGMRPVNSKNNYEISKRWQKKEYLRAHMARVTCHAQVETAACRFKKIQGPFHCS